MMCFLSASGVNFVFFFTSLSEQWHFEPYGEQWSELWFLGARSPRISVNKWGAVPSLQPHRRSPEVADCTLPSSPSRCGGTPLVRPHCQLGCGCEPRRTGASGTGAQAPGLGGPPGTSCCECPGHQDSPRTRPPPTETQGAGGEMDSKESKERPHTWVPVSCPLSLEDVAYFQNPEKSINSYFDPTWLTLRFKYLLFKRAAEDEMVGWHHWINGHELGWTPGDGEGQRDLAYCSPWGHEESDTTSRLNKCESMYVKFSQQVTKD